MLLFVLWRWEFFQCYFLGYWKCARGKLSLWLPQGKGRRKSPGDGRKLTLLNSDLNKMFHMILTILCLGWWEPHFLVESWGTAMDTVFRPYSVQKPRHLHLECIIIPWLPQPVTTSGVASNSLDLSSYFWRMKVWNKSSEAQMKVVPGLILL